ncbi:MAG: DnaB-like helicase C-terminal domain-containing protein, partial [Catalinimonas sp.]
PMYWVRQRRGIDYRVNESHILSLKKSRHEGKHRHGDVVNIEVRDYLGRSAEYRDNLKGYKVPVRFREQPLPLDPYFLGIWLGDGKSHDARVFTTDEEVVEEPYAYADTLGARVTPYQPTNRCPNDTVTQGHQGGEGFSVQDELRKLELLGNKHIPKEYRINSEATRLQLLAGLLDSNGHYLIRSNGYEITQKSERLARDFKFVADSLGFRTSLRPKRARVRAQELETEVYRVRIYGDVDRIPVRIERKCAPPRHSRGDRRMTGIELEADGVDDYYGFEIDGNRLFLLEDGTVTHNTAFVLSAARNAAVEFGQGVAVFSLEMASLQLVNRLISAEAELESDKIKKGNLAEYEWQQLYSRIGKLSEAPIFIDDTPSLTILELRAKARRLKAQHDIQLIIIDYLQLMSGDASGRPGGNREQEIAQISRSLKSLAKELNVPVIALSQLSRAVETRGGDKRPMLSDLRESGSIEQDADMVIFLYRPEYYQITEDEEGRPMNGLGEVIIAKHRNGSLDSVHLRFIGRFTKFMDQEPAAGGFDGTSSFEITRSSKINQPGEGLPKPDDKKGRSGKDDFFKPDAADAPF